GVSTEARAPLSVLCAAAYEGTFSVTISGVPLGPDAAAAWRALPPGNAIALTGRQKLYVYLASQQEMMASASAMFTRANRRASPTRSRPCSADTCWAISFQWPKA